MGKASSSKKVQRAARAAASSRGAGEHKERGFPLLVGLIVLLGIGLVFAARTSREPLVAPFTSDHWHSAYEIYDCGDLRPSIQDQTDPDGIHTHADSLIHIHPFNSSATGEDAAFSAFFNSSSLEVDEAGIRTSSAFDVGFTEIDNSTGCGDEESEIVLGRWDVGGQDGPELLTVFRSDFADVRFLEEGEAFTIAKAVVGEDPPPPSEDVLAQLASSTGSTNFASEPTLDLPPLDGELPAAEDSVPDVSVPDVSVPDASVPDDSGPDDGGTDDGETEPADDLPSSDDPAPAADETDTSAE